MDLKTVNRDKEAIIKKQNLFDRHIQVHLGSTTREEV